MPTFQEIHENATFEFGVQSPTINGEVALPTNGFDLPGFEPAKRAESQFARAIGKSRPKNENSERAMRIMSYRKQVRSGEFDRNQGLNMIPRQTY